MSAGALAPVQLALFDLDHTLIPFDSGMAWMAFLVARGVLPPSALQAYLAQCRTLVDGRLDLHAVHRALVAPLGAWTTTTLAQWGRDFGEHLASRVPEAMLALVRRHQQAGDRCVVVTATTRFVAEPVARLFGIDPVLATEPATVAGLCGTVYSGEIAGSPCHREHKPARVAEWLAQQAALAPDTAPPSLSGFARSWFYSDSISDLPLLQSVSDPVAVRPDARLRAVAQAAGWPIVEAGA